MSDEIDWERLARYVSGEATVAEAAEVARWVAGDASRRALVASVQQRWQAAGSPVRVDIDGAWQQLAARLPEARTAPARRSAEVVPLATYRRSPAKRLLPLAAAVVLAAGLGLGWQLLRRDAGPIGGAAVAASLEERTGVGERRSIDLPDGSRVILGARSLLRTAMAERGDRDVYLEGEALFTVRHDASRPFRVRAAGAITEDLGTSFSVRAYPGEAAVRVAVEEGSVSVRRERDDAAAATVLQARDVAELGAQGAPVVLREQPVERLLAWSRGVLDFRDTPLARVIVELERWYDVDIQLADSSLGRKPYTGTFDNESLDNVLQALAPALELQVERNGRVITLRAAGRAFVPPMEMPRRVEAGA